jgi:hypothetical protein
MPQLPHQYNPVCFTGQSFNVSNAPTQVPGNLRAHWL